MINATSRNYYVSPIEKLEKYDCEELYAKTLMRMKKNLIHYKTMNSLFEQEEEENKITKPIQLSDKLKFMQNFQQPKLYHFLRNPTQKKKEYFSFNPLSHRVIPKQIKEQVKTTNNSVQLSARIKQILLPETKVILRPGIKKVVKLTDKGLVPNKDCLSQREERKVKGLNSLNSDKIFSPIKKERNKSSKFLSKENSLLKKRLNNLLMKCDYNLRFNSYHFKELEKKINNGTNIVIKENFSKEIFDSIQ